MVDVPATHLDLMAWQSNTGIKCERWEIEVLMALGSTWYAVHHAPTTDNVTKPYSADVLAAARK